MTHPQRRSKKRRQFRKFNNGNASSKKHLKCDFKFPTSTVSPATQERLVACSCGEMKWLKDFTICLEDYRKRDS